MKRLFLLGFAGVLAGVLAGCPIYDDGNGGWEDDDEDCRDGKCDPGPDSEPECLSSIECGINETCGADNECHVGDCSFHGCSEGFTCAPNGDGTVSCQDKEGTSSSGEGGGGVGGSGAGGGVGGGGVGGGGPIVVYCGNPDDCAAGEVCAYDGTCKPGDCSTLGCVFGFYCDQNLTCQPSNPAACGADADCTGFGAGYLCVNGFCTAPADQCSDLTQCEVGHKCADGKCIAACASDADCPDGYACDENLGVCAVPADPCVVTNDCGGPDVVCVDGACVPKSSGATCPQGTVWVENGCIPDQAATFFCNAEGQQDMCAAGSVCLHHNCYIACEAPNDNACDNLPTFNVCKSVTTSSGAYKVCGSNQNLGGQCDPTIGNNCPGAQVCIDGFCK